jgi:hypothetical protein
MNDERSRDRSDDRSDHSTAPDPNQDSWSAWLPQLDPTNDRTPPDESAGPHASAGPPARTTPIPPRPALPHAPPPPRPGMPELPHLPPPMSRMPAGSGWGYPSAPPMRTVNRAPNNHLLAAILVTIFCFWPFGVIAIVKAASVNPRWARGDRDGAYRAARAAKTWSLAALAAGLLIWLGSAAFGWMVWAFIN